MMPYRCIGVMSGTSGDGVDAVLLELDDVYVPHEGRIIERASVPFEPELMEEIVHPQALTLKRLVELHYMLPQLYARTVQMMPQWRTAHCCGVHGQTVAHQVQSPPPAHRGTLQIGVTAVLAQQLQMPVVGDLRAMDVSLGGQGAPIVPVAHWFFMSAGPRPPLVVNLGGICNITMVSADLAAVQGYDVGPGMMLSDAYARMMSGGALTCDRDGAISAQGQIIPSLLQELLGHPFVARPAPKSAGREEFGRSFYEPILQRYHAACASADVMRTLVEGTAHILKRTMDKDFGQAPPFARLVLTGGGALNPQMRRAMAQVFAPIAVEVAEEGVMAPQNHEPAAMALIAARTMHGLPSALPQVTGAPFGSVLGHICRPTPSAFRLQPGGITKQALRARLRQTVTERVRAVVGTMLADHAATGVGFALHQQHELVHAEAFGVAKAYDVHKDAPNTVRGVADAQRRLSTTPQHLFDVASLTKVLATSACIMALISDGRLALHARASLFVPAFGSTDKQMITIGQLLSHRSGLSAWAPLYLLADNPAEALQWIASSPLQHAPDTQRLYSDLGYIVLGAIIENVTQTPLNVYFNSRIAAPLHNPAVGFGADLFGSGNAQNHLVVATAHNNSHEERMAEDPAKNQAYAAQLAQKPSRPRTLRVGTQQGQVNDGNSHFVFGGTAAHAGLFATAGAVGQVLSAMTCPSHFGGANAGLFAPEVVSTFVQPASGNDFLGFANPCTWQSFEPWHGTLANHGCLITEGFTGCFAIAVPTVGVTLTLLSNRQHQSDASLHPLPKLYPYWAQVVGGLLQTL